MNATSNKHAILDDGDFSYPTVFCRKLFIILHILIANVCMLSRMSITKIGYDTLAFVLREHRNK